MENPKPKWKLKREAREARVRRLLSKVDFKKCSGLVEERCDGGRDLFLDLKIERYIEVYFGNEVLVFAEDWDSEKIYLLSCTEKTVERFPVPGKIQKTVRTLCKSVAKKKPLSALQILQKITKNQ